MRYLLSALVFVLTLMNRGSLLAAYQNPVLRVLLFQSTGGIYLHNPNGMTLYAKNKAVGTGNRILLKHDSADNLLVNNKIRFKDPVQITATGGTDVLDLDRNTRRRYLGAFEIRRHKNRLAIINLVSTESYLEGVLNAEISTRWHMEVVKAQAVISRTFALFKREKRMNDPWHLSAGQHDQVYKGVEIADDRGRSAIRQTTGIVVAYKGRLAQTFYHSNCGGMTADPGKTWQHNLPYLKVMSVPFGRTDPRYHWETVIDDQEMLRILRKTGFPDHSVDSISISRRTASNRVFELTVTGEKSRTVSGYQFRQASGYKRIQSLLFDIKRISGGFHFKGTGNGHGVGLSQWSAKEMAEEGYQYHEIIYYFYPGIELMRHQG